MTVLKVLTGTNLKEIEFFSSEIGEYDTLKEHARNKERDHREIIPFEEPDLNNPSKPK